MMSIILAQDDGEHPDILLRTVGHSQEDKVKNHERIVEVAAARIRESGTADARRGRDHEVRRADPRRLLQALRLSRRPRRRGRRPRARRRRGRDAHAHRGRRRSAGGLRRLVHVRRTSRRSRRGLCGRGARVRRPPRRGAGPDRLPRAGGALPGPPRRRCSAAARMPAAGRSWRSARSWAACSSRAPWTTSRSRTRSCARCARPSSRCRARRTWAGAWDRTVRAGPRSPWGM